MLAWLDIETTGLDPQTCRILEIGFIITDDDLKEVARASWVIVYSGPVDDFIRKMHGPDGSRLLEECNGAKAKSASWNVVEIERFLHANLKNEIVPLCGSTVGFDKSFFKASGTFAPLLDLFHYRILDISSVKEMARRWAPDVYESRPKSRGIHRALPDLEDSIAEAEHYKKYLFEGAWVSMRTDAEP